MATTRKKPDTAAAEKLAATPPAEPEVTEESATPTPDEAAPNAVTEAEVKEQAAEQPAEGTTENQPAAQVKLQVGTKIQFTPEDRDEVVTGTVMGLGSDDENVLAQWNGQEAWIPTKGITALPS